MYELLVLSLLMHWPLHSHRIAKIANEIIGTEEQFRSSTLSVLLNHLMDAGLITIHAGPTPFPTDRSSRIYAITEAGRERFLELMLDTTSDLETCRKMFHIKVLHLEFLPLAHQLHVVEYYLVYCRQVMHSKEDDLQSMAIDPYKRKHMSPSFQAAVAALARLKADHWYLEMNWALLLREQIISRMEQGPFENWP